MGIGAGRVYTPGGWRRRRRRGVSLESDLAVVDGEDGAGCGELLGAVLSDGGAEMVGGLGDAEDEGGGG